MTRRWRSELKSHCVWKKEVWWVRRKGQASNEILAAGPCQSLSEENSHRTDHRILYRCALPFWLAGNCPRSIQPGRRHRRRRPPRHNQQDFVDTATAAFLPRSTPANSWYQASDVSKLVWRRLPGREEFLPPICRGHSKPESHVSGICRSGGSVEGICRGPRGGHCWPKSCRSIRVESGRSHPHKRHDLYRSMGVQRSRNLSRLARSG